MTPLIIVVIALALFFSLLNGMHDSRNVVSTLISSRAYPPRVALGVTALAEFCGPFLFGIAVAQTIGGIVNSSAVNPQVLAVALAAAIFWNLVTWFMRIPSSSSQALVGGILGAVWVQAGLQSVHAAGLSKVLISLFASPVIGFIFGWILLRWIYRLSWNATPRINDFFRRAQLVTAIALGLSHGSNDSQKAMGVITLALVTGGYASAFVVPIWVIALCALALSLGTITGGWNLMHKVGGPFYKIRPVDGFATQLSSSLVVIGASLVGGPVSATQVINSAIMGVGTAERASKVRWGIAQEIITGWLLTIPASTLIAAGLFLILKRLGL